MAGCTRPASMAASLDLERKGLLLLLDAADEHGHPDLDFRRNGKKSSRLAVRRLAVMAHLALLLALLGAFLVLVLRPGSTLRWCPQYCHRWPAICGSQRKLGWSDYSGMSGGLGSVSSDRDDSRTALQGVATTDNRGWTPSIRRQATTTSSSTPATGTVLECFQVHQPVLTPQGATYDITVSGGTEATATSSDGSSANDTCTILLMEHVFAHSYNQPYIGNYTPPSCHFNRVVMNFTVVSQGRQFDRLALMYFGNTEVWRTSTAEPTVPPGIRWVYLKDMTEYLYFWREPQKLIFDLGNLVSDIYTGTFNTTLTATFFYEEVDTDGALPSDLIIPISKRQGDANAVSQFTLPADNATNTISFPQNANRAVFSVSANGQANEEFWWSNVPQSDANAFQPTAGTFPGYSPWREVQVFIDGQLAGVQWPFPVVFTGGVVPSLHRPIVGPDAFDLREHEIDITPWLPLLCDGARHTFTIEVAGLNDDGDTSASVTRPVGSSWYVTGKIFVWLDDEGSITTGDAPTTNAAAPTIMVSQVLTQNSTGSNETLAYDTAVSRSFSVSSKVVSQNFSGTVTWLQTLSYSNKGYVSGYGYNQINDFIITGADAASGLVDYKAQYKYPLYCNSTYNVAPEGNTTIRARLIQGVELYIQGAAVFPTGLEAFSHGKGATKYTASLLNTTKDGTASYFAYGNNTYSTGSGSADQVFTFGGFTGPDEGSMDAAPDEPDVQLYYRHVAATNGTVTLDIQTLTGVGTDGYSGGGGDSSSVGYKTVYPPAPENGGTGPRVFINRQSAVDEL